MKSSFDPAAVITNARQVLAIEADAVAALQAHIDEEFVTACRLIYECSGRVVVTGLGKSGHIGNKIAATLASTGTPAFFLHAAEASHGDIGMITSADVVLAVSNSGETSELVAMLPVIKRLGVALIALTGRSQSTLARAANVVLNVSVPKEACPLDLAPTASTTATLAMGDALAIALLDARGFTKNDFALSHPGGNLGRRLLLRVEDIMRTGDLIPKTAPDASLHDGLVEMGRKGLGMTTIVDPEGRVLGIFTDGDLRRLLEHPIDLKTAIIESLMTRAPKTIQAHVLAAEAAHLMEKAKVTALPVLNSQGILVGALNAHDLMRAGVM